MRNLGCAGTWWGAYDITQWPAEVVELAKKENWDPLYKDRRQELVIIGIKPNEEEIRKALDECLLTDEEMQLDPNEWKKFNDPFPAWNTQG